MKKGGVVSSIHLKKSNTCWNRSTGTAENKHSIVRFGVSIISIGMEIVIQELKSAD